MRHIYLDHNATTPLLPEVAAAMDECQRSGLGNPASQHQAGQRARQLLEDAREQIGRLLGADLTGRQPDRVIFTSGGTEANNLAILGLGGSTPGEAIASAIEHPSVAGPFAELERRSWTIHRLGVSSAGVVCLDELQALLARPIRLVSVMLGNNETGVLQPIREIAAMCTAVGVPLHTDAVQAVGKLPVNFRTLGVTALSLTAHKFHGPLGVGALVVRYGVTVEPILFGGFQQEGLRPGSESVALAVALRRALEIFADEACPRAERLTRLRDRFEERLSAGYPGLVVNGDAARRLPHTSNVAFRGLDRQKLLVALDLAGVACSTGSACASGSSEPSPVLLAMGCEREVVSSALRFSLGATTTEADIDEAVERILDVCSKLASQRARPTSAHASRQE